MTTTTTPTGYETYTADERAAMVRRLEADMRYERGLATGTDLRAEIAQANVREFARQIAAIRRTK
jgi:hypothetical protein